jgi:DNA-binding protein H-NS
MAWILADPSDIGESAVAKINGLEKLSYGELAELRNRVDRMMVAKRNEAREQLRGEITAMLKDHGLSAQDLFGRARKGGTVAPKYRDPKKPDNTWTGRGRMPRWLVAATRGGKAKRDDFLI